MPRLHTLCARFVHALASIIWDARTWWGDWKNLTPWIGFLGLILNESQGVESGQLVDMGPSADADN